MTTIERRVRIFRDSDAFNPREEYDCNVGRMLCWHSRYNLGDEHNYDSDTWKEELACEADADLADKLEELRENVWDAIYSCLVWDGNVNSEDANLIADRRVEARCNELIDRAFDDGYVALPLYLYDHSGITMNTGGFSCGWDSGCVGVIVCTKEQVQEEWGGDEDKAKHWLRIEVETYDHYLTGNVWGFSAEEREEGDWEDDEGWEEVDGCGGGIFGDYDCIKDELGADFADAFESAEISYA